mgnify:CR=1 FL=1
MKKLFLSSCFLFLTGLTALSQEAFDKTNIVNRLANLMNENYVFPDKGKAMYDLIKSKLEKGQYEGISSAEAFAKQLDADLKSIIHDKHIRVKYDEARVKAMQNQVPGGGRKSPENFGFKEVKILRPTLGIFPQSAYVL